MSSTKEIKAAKSLLPTSDRVGNFLGPIEDPVSKVRLVVANSGMCLSKNRDETIQTTQNICVSPFILKNTWTVLT